MFTLIKFRTPDLVQNLLLQYFLVHSKQKMQLLYFN
jgi:hypothetical protein